MDDCINAFHCLLPSLIHVEVKGAKFQGLSSRKIREYGLVHLFWCSGCSTNVVPSREKLLRHLTPQKTGASCDQDFFEAFGHEYPCVFFCLKICCINANGCASFLRRCCFHKPSRIWCGWGYHERDGKFRGYEDHKRDHERNE